MSETIPPRFDNFQLETRSDPSSGEPEYGGADPRALKHDTGQAFSFHQTQENSFVSKAHGGLCEECGGTEMCDSGGVYPWGEHISIPCGCSPPKPSSEPTPCTT